MLFLAGCRDKVVSLQPPAGEQTLTVTAITYDDFERPVAPRGTISVTLVGEDRVVKAIIPDGSTSCEFHGLPVQEYLLTAEKDGCYRSETVAGNLYVAAIWSQTIRLYQHPSPAMRIDSIAVTSAPSSNIFLVRLVTGQTAPPRYQWNAIVFFSRSAAIVPSSGKYDVAQQISGTGNVITANVSKFFLPGPSGSRIYVTARLTTGATQYTYDSTLNIPRYINLEDNTTIVSSFVPQ